MTIWKAVFSGARNRAPHEGSETARGRGTKRRLTAGLAFLAAASIGVIAAVPANAAVTVKPTGSCTSNNLCLYYKTGQSGAVVAYSTTTAIKAKGSSQTSIINVGSTTYPGSATGHGQKVASYAASVKNTSGSTITLYSGPDGTTKNGVQPKLIPPGWSGSLDVLTNKVQSIRVYPVGSYQVTGATTYSNTLTASANGTIAKGQITTFDCYSTGRTPSKSSNDQIWGHVKGTSQWVSDEYINLNGQSLNKLVTTECASSYANGAETSKQKSVVTLLNSYNGKTLSSIQNSTQGQKWKWDKDEWCGDFASFILNLAGMDIKTAIPAARSFESDNTHFVFIPKGSKPQVGDVAMWAFSGSVIHHVNIVTSVTSATNFDVIGGNQTCGSGSTNCVTQRTINLNATGDYSNAHFMGFARPIQ